MKLLLKMVEALNSAKKLQETSEDELEKALQRTKEVMKMGTGVIEIASGYGLTTEAELKCLWSDKEIKRNLL